MFPSIEKTIGSINKFSTQDGKTWNNLYSEYLSNRTSIIASLNSSPRSLSST
jgi:beta-carotene ketolase (CrtO type)